MQIVHDLDITDKHRLLVVVTHALIMGNTLHITRNDLSDPEFGIELPPTVVKHQGQLLGVQYPWAVEDGVEVHWIPLRGPPNPTFEMAVNSTVQIAFEQIGTLKRAPLIQLLTQVCNGVEAAIHTFDGCF